MQLAIDILAETPAALRLAAQFLIEHAVLRELIERGEGAPPVRTSSEVPPPPAPLAPAAPMHSGPTDHAVIVVPPAPPPPPPVVPPAPIVTAPAAPDAPSAGPVTDEFDSSGVPFDERIHQKSRNKKNDGTWKIRKRLEAGIVENVMRELSSRIRVGTPTAPLASEPNPAAVFGRTPLPAGASAPVPLPPASPSTAGPAQIPVPPPPAAQAQGQVPPAPITTPGAEGPGVDPFRSLVTKITNARRENRLTPEEITQCVTGAGAPSLQLLNNMPHLIPNVEFAIDMILATR